MYRQINYLTKSLKLDLYPLLAIESCVKKVTICGWLNPADRQPRDGHGTTFRQDNQAIESLPSGLTGPAR